MATRQPNSLQIRDNDLDDSLWDSPVKPVTNAKGSAGTINSKPGAGSKSTYEEQQSHEESLRRELASVRKVNETIEGVIQGLERAKGNMKTVNQTVGAASSLLNTWTRILSQTEHNQRLILDPAWQGTTQDMADMESEAVSRQQTALRREAEEQERKAAAARRVEDEERRRAVEGSKPQKSTTRGRGRVTARGAATSGYVAGDSTGNSSSIGRGLGGSRRTTSGIGRGRGTRGRG